MRPRKHKLADEIAELTQEQLEQLDRWLERFTYAKVRGLFLQTFGKTITDSKLCRYFQRRQEARLLSHPGQPGLAAADLVAIRDGAPLPDSRINKYLLQKRCFELITSQVHTPARLRELQDICTYEERRALAERNASVNERLVAARARRAELRGHELAFKASKTAQNQPNAGDRKQ